MFEVCWKFKKISLSDNEWQSFQLKRRSKHRIKSTKKVKWCLMERIMISLFFSDISQLNWYKKSVYWINTTDSQEDFLSSFSWSIHNCTFQRFGGKINHFLLVTLHLLSWQSPWNWIEREPSGYFSSNVANTNGAANPCRWISLKSIHCTFGHWL